MPEKLLSLPILARQVAEGLRAATRQGAAVDTPEGSRFIVLSDTLAEQIANDLDQALELGEVQRLKEPARL